MRSLDDILAISAERHGGVDAVLGNLTPSLTADEVRAIPDDRWLAEMARSIFQAGFSWKTVNTMWPGFEEAFQGFDPGWCAHIEDERFDSLVTNTAIVRHGPKIRSVATNAAFVQSQSPFGAYVASFESERYIDLLMDLKSKGHRLGGTSGQYFLRSLGVDGFILSRDVVARLNAEGVVDGAVTSKKAMKAAQDAFTEWRAQSGRSLKEISRILATSIG